MSAVTLIVVHNTPADLRACLRGLLESGAPEESVFVADNASTDGMRSPLEREFPRVVWQRHARNLLYARALNGLLAVSESDWVLLLNPDVRARYGELLSLCERWHGDPRCAAVAPQCRYFDGRVQPTCRRLPDALTVWRELSCYLLKRPSQWRMDDFDHRSPCAVAQPLFSCLWIRRSALAVVGDLDEHYPLFFNDVDWCRRALAKGYEIRFDPSVAVLHRLGGTTRAYPLRKLNHSHRSFARYVWNLDSFLGWRLLGLLGIALAYVCRAPAAMFRLLQRGPLTHTSAHLSG